MPYLLAAAALAYAADKVAGIFRPSSPSTLRTVVLVAAVVAATVVVSKTLSK